MDESRQRPSILKNVVYGFSTWILPLGLAFIVTPVIIRALGNHDYGIYALVLGFVSYSFNFNIGRAITKYLSERQDNEDTIFAGEVLSASLVINLIVGGIGLVTILALSGWMVTDVFQIEESSRGDAVAALRTSGFIIFFLMLSHVFNSVTLGLHRFDVYAKIQNFNSFAVLLGNLFLALAGYGLNALLYLNLGVCIVTAGLAYAGSRHLLPDVRFGFRFGSTALASVARFTISVVAFQIAANVLLLFERSWITARLGAEALTFYVVPMTLGIYMLTFIASVSMVIFPLASERSSDTEGLLRLYRRATRFICFLIIFFAATLIAHNESLLTLWVGPEFGERSSDLLVLHAISFGLTAMTIVAYQLAEGLGRPSFNFWAMLAGMLVAIPVMVFMTGRLGSYGVGIGRLAGFSVVFLATFYLEYLVFGSTRWRLWISIAGKLGLAAVISGLAQATLIDLLGRSWLSIAVAVAAGAAGYAAVAFLTRFATADDIRFISSLRTRS